MASSFLGVGEIFGRMCGIHIGDFVRNINGSIPILQKDWAIRNRGYTNQVRVGGLGLCSPRLLVCRQFKHWGCSHINHSQNKKKAITGEVNCTHPIKGKKKKTSPGQLRSPWAEWEPLTTEVQEVAEKFVMANCYDPKKAMQLFDV